MLTSAKTFRWAARAENTVAAVKGDGPKLIGLGGGLGFPDELPNIVSEAIVAAERRAEGLQYGPLFGLDDLRDAIVRYLADDGITATRDNILIVNGAKQGLDLACRVFMEKGDTIIVSAPTYLTAVSILKTHEVNFLSILQDADGMKVDELEARLVALRRDNRPLPKLLFDIPDFHNPTGITLSVERRQRMVELARDYGFRILEDDPYRRIRFEGEPVPPIKTFDVDGHVIGLGTVSKILAPGLRIGWVNADPAIVRRMAAQKSDHGTNPFVQRIVAQLFENGKLSDHITSLKTTLRIHRDTMIDALRQYLPDAIVQRPAGGYFLWVELPKGIDALDLTRVAAEHGVEIFPGQSSFAVDAPTNFFRMAYSYCSIDEIKTGIRKLGEAYDELTAQPRLAATTSR